jgi:uncharacterized protein (DUF1684 family)
LETGSTIVIRAPLSRCPAGRRRPSASRLVVLGLLVAFTASCGGPSANNAASYAATILAERATKDELFRTATDSPVPADKRGALLPLSYFPPDESYAVPAALGPAEPGQRPTVEMPTSTGQRRLMQRVGMLDFMLKGRSLHLSAFMEAGSPDTNRLFVPFTDLTTGTETYAAGRYLDLDRTASGVYLIDFNKAYQPYCSYNATYDCPYPPAENRLPIPIRAGEKLARG